MKPVISFAKALLHTGYKVAERHPGFTQRYFNLKQAITSTNLLHRMKIYLAGPEVFERDPIAKGKLLKELCVNYGVEGLFPMDNELGTEEHGSLAQAAAIRSANMNFIKSCDAIIANMAPFRGPSMDVGTAYEMGVGAALGKIVVGYCRDQRSFVERVQQAEKVERGVDGTLRDREGMAVEEFGDKGAGLVDNLMVTCGVERLCGSAEEAIRTVVELFKEREKAGA